MIVLAILIGISFGHKDGCRIIDDVPYSRKVWWGESLAKLANRL